MRRGLATLVAGLLASPALADAVLPIGGAFGNEAGCAFFMTGEPPGGEVLLVTPDTFTAHATGCYFERLVLNRDHTYAVEAACAVPGEQGSRRGRVTVTDRGRSGVHVRIGEGTDWGPLFRCPGTEGLFDQPGVPA